MKSVIQNTYKNHENTLNSYVFGFDDLGEQFGKADRNTIKLFDLEGKKINIKAFKIPNVVNQIAYKFFRKSKAQRSFEYANKLTELGIGTPQPIAYYEFTTPFLYKKSFYISEHLDCDLTYRALVTHLDYPDHDKILRAFTKFTFNLHEKNINFLDHSPGNTLIKKTESGYAFYLVDLNRMVFKKMTFEERMKNFARLTVHESMIKTMSDEYAKLSGEDYDKIFNLMLKNTRDFQQSFHRRRKLKKKLKFWKK